MTISQHSDSTLLSDLCLNYQDRIENVQEGALINKNSEQNEIIELTANDSSVAFVRECFKKKNHHCN
jgi:hypothetical protein